MGSAIDLSGQRFGRLLVIQRVPRTKVTGGIRWLCLCDCGRELVTRSAALRAGRAKSCGCARAGSLVKHGLSRTPEYFVWKSMLYRCQRPSHPAFKRYGGRGIRVCKRWLSLNAFIADMGPRPTELHTLERIDNNGNYEPENCRWATMGEQAKNKSSNHRITLDGETKTITEWSRLRGINATTISDRLKRGWSPDRALNPQSGRSRRPALPQPHL